MADTKYNAMLSILANKVNEIIVTDSTKQVDADEMNTQITAIQDLISDITSLNYSKVFNVLDYGADPSGNSDSTTAIQAAINDAVASGGGTVYSPFGFYKATGTLTCGSNIRLVAAKNTIIALNSASVGMLFNLDNADNCTIENFILDGTNALRTDKFISMTNSTNCVIEDCVFKNPSASVMGSVVITNGKYNSIIHNQFISSAGTAISLSGTTCQFNTVQDNKISDSVNFGIRLGEGANRNIIEENKTTSNGIELIGITSDCYMNRIALNHAEGCGDNGISVSGYNNTVIGNVCYKNQKGGIGIWGAFNTIVGNECLNNNQVNSTYWPGIWVHAAYGGLGSYNTIVGNTCDDDQSTKTQYNGIRLNGSGYTNWASGQSVNVNEYRVYGLNIYKATTAGTTGATAPTHTTGSVSDGGVTWQYLRSFLSSVGTRYNTVANNIVPRAVSTLEADIDSNWTYNTLISPSAKRKGWASPTGTTTRTAFDTSTATTADLAQRLKALIDDLTAYGIIGS